MNDHEPVKRSNLKYANQYLLTHPEMALTLAIIFDVLAIAMFFGSGGLTTHLTQAQMKARIVAGIAITTSFIMFYYAGKGFQERKK